MITVYTQILKLILIILTVQILQPPELDQSSVVAKSCKGHTFYLHRVQKLKVGSRYVATCVHPSYVL